MKTKMIVKLFVLFILLNPVVFIQTIAATKSYDRGYIPINGFVPNKETAIKIALAVWLPIYGNVIYREKPYTAELKGEVWVVEGSLKKGEVGGVALIVIQKKDGKIIRVYHGK